MHPVIITRLSYVCMRMRTDMVGLQAPFSSEISWKIVLHISMFKYFFLPYKYAHCRKYRKWKKKKNIVLSPRNTNCSLWCKQTIFPTLHHKYDKDRAGCTISNNCKISEAFSSIYVFFLYLWVGWDSADLGGLGWAWSQVAGSVYVCSMGLSFFWACFSHTGGRSSTRNE